MEQIGTVRENVGTLITDWIQQSGLSTREVANRAGVSTSTLHRVAHNQVDPSYKTLREIAIACGKGIDLTGPTLSDPAAAAAARVILDGEEPDRPEVTTWVERLHRQRPHGNPIDILVAAGQASAPLARPRAHHFTGTATIATVASAADSAGGHWALSGQAGLELPRFWDPTPVPTILWTTHSDHVAQLLGDSELRPSIRTSTSTRRTTLTVLSAHDSLFTDAFTHDRLHYVAPIQIMLDCFGIGGVPAELARKEVLSWPGTEERL